MEMLKKIFSLMAVLMVFSLAGCGNGNQAKTGADIPFAADSTAVPDGTESEARTEEEPGDEKDSSAIESSENSNILIAYFSRTGNTDFPDGIDAVASASLIVKDGAMYGNTQYIASLIQRATGGEMFLIEVQEKYPADYDDTDEQAEKEQKENARPQLASKIDNLDDYGTIFLGFPNWYYDMPMAVYSFLDEYDLSGKTIIPFVTSGGSGFSDALSTIREMEPGADVISEGFKTTHSRVEDVTYEDVENWLAEIGIVEKE